MSREICADHLGRTGASGHVVCPVDTARDEALPGDPLWQAVKGGPLGRMLRCSVRCRPTGIRSCHPLLRNVPVGLGGVGQPRGSDTGENRGLRGPIVVGLVRYNLGLEE